ncbi:MAG: DUF1838 family protein [Gammaproteobacteria bacterium]|nr:DUF1838 family protein [Gammaproteobacteria bacterium]
MDKKQQTPPAHPHRVTRRDALTGAAGLAGLALGGSVQAGGHASLDLDDPRDNLTALIKLQADTSGADVISGFPGEVWGWVPGEGNKLLFRSYGIGASHVEETDEGWRFYHRELMYYLDPETGEILNTWTNPYTGRTVEVLHILNDPVHRFYAFDGGRFAFPWPYTVMGDDLVFRISVFSFRDSVMPRLEYPVHSADNKYQAAELWMMNGRVGEVMNPDITSASCVTSWARVGQWLPFMEMGNRPGVMVYHCDSYKLLEGVQQIPADILAYTEKHHAKYLQSPSEWQSLRLNESQLTVSKREVDERWDSEVRPVGSVFEVD